MKFNSFFLNVFILSAVLAADEKQPRDLSAIKRENSNVTDIGMVHTYSNISGYQPKDADTYVIKIGSVESYKGLTTDEEAKAQKQNEAAKKAVSTPKVRRLAIIRDMIDNTPSERKLYLKERGQKRYKRTRKIQQERSRRLNSVSQIIADALVNRRLNVPRLPAIPEAPKVTPLFTAQYNNPLIQMNLGENPERYDREQLEVDASGTAKKDKKPGPMKMEDVFSVVDPGYSRLLI